MPSEVSITFCILQTTYYPPITRSQLKPTALGQGITPLHDLLIKLRIGGPGYGCLLYARVQDDFLRRLDLVCMQGYGESRQLYYACLSQAVSTMYSSTSSTGWAPLESGPPGEVLKVGIRFPMSYDTLIAEVVEVFVHQKGSRLSNGVAR
jgi:hypothetical protein